MNRQMEFEITTPERTVLKTLVESATLPTQEGEITVLPGHVPLVANLVPGMVTLRVNGEDQYLACSGGFIEVQPTGTGGRIIILADTAERAEELDMAKVEEARERARQALANRRAADDVATAAAAAAMERELSRLKGARKHRSRGVPEPRG